MACGLRMDIWTRVPLHYFSDVDQIHFNKVFITVRHPIHRIHGWEPGTGCCRKENCISLIIFTSLFLHHLCAFSKAAYIIIEAVGTGHICPLSLLSRPTYIYSLHVYIIDTIIRAEIKCVRTPPIFNWLNHVNAWNTNPQTPFLLYLLLKCFVA